MSDRPNTLRARLGQRIATYQGIQRSPLWLIVPLSISVIAWTAGLSGWFSEPLTRVLFVMGFCHLAMTLIIFQRFRVPRKVELHQKGLVLTTGVREISLAWDQICELYQIPVNRRRLIPFANADSGEPTTWRYRIVCRHGRRVGLSDYEGIRGLGRRIEAEVSKRLFSLAKDSFHAGYTVRFGRRLGLSNAGIHVGVKCLPWHEIANVSIEWYCIRIAKANHRVIWIRIPVSQVANLQILARLLDSIRDTMASVSDERPMDEFGIGTEAELQAELGHDLNELIARGYNLEEIREVLDGESTLEQLSSRSPNHRPRYPR